MRLRSCAAPCNVPTGIGARGRERGKSEREGRSLQLGSYLGSGRKKLPAELDALLPAILDRAFKGEL